MVLSRYLMKRQVQIPVVLFLYLQCAHSRRPTPRSTPAPSLPAVLRDGDLAAWKVPNEIFCHQMETSLDRTHLILPWWHHYCQDFKDNKAKQPPKSYNYLPVHRAALDKLRWYRRNGARLDRINRMLGSWVRNS